MTRNNYTMFQLRHKDYLLFSAVFVINLAAMIFTKMKSHTETHITSEI